MSTPTDRPQLLPVTRAALASAPGLLVAVREIGVRRGFDYTDDAATATLLKERRKAVGRVSTSAPVWLGCLAVVAAAVWPFVSPGVPALAGKPPAVLYGPALPLLLVGGGLWVLVWRRWKRELLHPHLVGYREVIGLAQAYGVPVTHIPDWLVGRTDNASGKGAAPIPSYDEVKRMPSGGTHQPPAPGDRAQGQARDQAQPEDQARVRDAAHAPYTPALPALPAKPFAVSTYEATAEDGGWHGEGGCLLFIAGVIGAGYGATEDVPGALLAGILIPVAIMVWVVGARRSGEREALREEAVAYVRALAAAQAAGVRIPELSPILRKLLAEETERAAE
ncbi:MULTISPECIES: hypothetical protein [unclassified Streptomyces]|uniref:hypothetical protein n=1 Tax=unclassified Streptomyces TaxID=2593676 RepID=UPI00340C90F6